MQFHKIGAQGYNKSSSYNPVISSLTPTRAYIYRYLRKRISPEGEKCQRQNNFIMQHKKPRRVEGRGFSPYETFLGYPMPTALPIPCAAAFNAVVIASTTELSGV